MAKCRYCGKKIPKKELSSIDACPTCSEKWVHNKLPIHFTIEGYDKGYVRKNTKTKIRKVS